MNHIMIKPAAALLLIITMFLASCGGGAKKEEAKTDTAAMPQNTPVQAAEGEITVNVTGNTMADMAYDPQSITVKEGQKIKLTLVNQNTTEGMLHNWVLVDLGSGQEVATAAMAAGPDKAYIPENKHVIAASPLAKPKETVSFEFTAPAKGSYNYICTFPGHFPKMVGKLIVE